MNCFSGKLLPRPVVCGSYLRQLIFGSCTIDSKNELPLINVQAVLNLYYDLEVLSPTKCKNRGKVRLVGRFYAPLGAKTGVKCTWW